MKHIVKGRITDKEQKLIIADISKHSYKASAAALYRSDKLRKDSVDTSVRGGLTRFISPELIPNTSNILQSLFYQSLPSLSYIFRECSMPAIQYTCYNNGDFFKWHQDCLNEPGKTDDRIFTMSINLTSEEAYKGGELQLKYKEDIIELGKLPGSYIIFPSFIRHQACPVLENKRENIVVWLSCSKTILETYRNSYYAE